jgi:tetratricopeptide (TPR) repeat protein
LALLLVSAAPRQEPEELVRQANAAFDRQEFDAAVKLYTDAEGTIDNPGLVSFNKGAALYRLGRFRDAQQHFQRCLDEADPSRRPAMLYNLGNCLLQQAQAGGDLSLFREAVDAFARCLRQEAIQLELRDSARHNLELTKLLWLQARLAHPNQQEKDPGSDPNPEPPKQDKSSQDQEKTPEGADPTPGTKPKQVAEKKSKVDKKEGKEKAIETEDRMPGKGNIPPPPDDATLKKMSPEDAIKNIDSAVERIREERSRYRQRSAPVPSREFPDY